MFGRLGGDGDSDGGGDVYVVGEGFVFGVRVRVPIVAGGWLSRLIIGVGVVSGGVQKRLGWRRVDGGV